VENQGDGTVMQQSEVQEVTFSAGMGVGGSVTLTYTDLYGQSWTTRPISLGEGSHYVLDYALGSGIDPDKAYLVLQYGASSTAIATGTNTLSDLNAKVIRSKLLTMANIYNLANPVLAKRANLARSIRVTERAHETSHKFTTGIEASKKKTFDIYITGDEVTGFNENGGMLAFNAFLSTSGSVSPDTTEINEGHAFVQVTSGSDASANIKSALLGLPNNVIPSVTVSKVDITSENTDDLGSNGNAYHQRYSITFASTANSGDQNMLSCDATPCDNDGCVNRKMGAASVHYIHADSTTGADGSGASSTGGTAKTAKINFQAKGFFIMDIHSDTQDNPNLGHFSSGTAWVDWNTGSGVERAEFPIIATHATVETALRGITGWSGVTVTSQCAGTSPCTTLSHAHSYTVKFPSGYDDGGQTPGVGLKDQGGSMASSGTIIIYDQRFSNSLWLGDISGYHLISCTFNSNAIDTCEAFGDDTTVAAESTNAGTTIQPEIGDKFDISIVQFGHEKGANGHDGNVKIDLTASGGNTKRSKFTNLNNGTVDFGLGKGYLGADVKAYVRVDHTADMPTQTSQNTEHYFAVGSTLEVLDTTWDNSDLAANDPVTANVYRSFKVLSHVKNTHGTMFAKLDSTPTTDSSTNYALKVTQHNSTVTRRKNIDVNAAQQEVQIIQPTQSNVLLVEDTDTFRIYINENKANVEFTEVLSGLSSTDQVAEAINSFGALSGPVVVTKVLKEWTVTFAAIDGDVPQLSISEVVDGGNANDWAVHTVVDGWSFFAGKNARLENVQPGAVINITSQEVVTFTIGGWTAGDLIASYDGNVGSVPLEQGTVNAAKVVLTVNSILNHKKEPKFAIIAGDVTTGSATSIVIEMPEGVDASKLELFPAGDYTVTTGITKSVAKNNNGKSFKVVRVENKLFDLSAPTGKTVSTLQYSIHNKAALTVGDEVTISRLADGTACQFLESNGAVSVIASVSALISVPPAHAATPTTTYTVGTAFTYAVSNGCAFSAYRTVLVVDSMPDALAAASTGANIEMDIYGAKGSCSVSETVKGTYESDVCSSRGNCDGAAGLCTCHEGYSGEACETQTVLV
jgi:hypothetical protein